MPLLRNPEKSKKKGRQQRRRIWPSPSSSQWGPGPPGSGTSWANGTSCKLILLDGQASDGMFSHCLSSDSFSRNGRAKSSERGAGCNMAALHATTFRCSCRKLRPTTASTSSPAPDLSSAIHLQLCELAILTGWRSEPPLYSATAAKYSPDGTEEHLHSRAA